jgi:hypothetical protein
MTLQDLGSIGELVGALAVVVSLAYIAYQIRQNARQLEQNTRSLEATMFQASNDAVSRFWALLAQDASLVDIWTRALTGQVLDRTEITRFEALLSIVFCNFESVVHHSRLSAVDFNAIEIYGPAIAQLLAVPHVQKWWRRVAPQTFTKEFRIAIEALLPEDEPEEGRI